MPVFPNAARPCATAFVVVAAALSVLPGACASSLQEMRYNSSDPMDSLMKLQNDIVAMITADSKELSADMTKTVKSTIEMLDKEVNTSIKKSHLADTKALRALKEAFEKCSRGRKQYVMRINGREIQRSRILAKMRKCKIGSRPETEETRLKTWIASKANARDACFEQKTSCDKWAEHAANPPVQECKRYAKAGYVPWIKGNAVRLWLNWIQRHDYLQKICTRNRKKCIDARKKQRADKNKWLMKRRTCRALQERHELWSCKILDETLSVNSYYPNCYNPALSAYQKEVVLLRKQEANRNYEYISLARVKCYLNVFTLTDATKKTAELNKCRATDFSTTKYNLNYWPAPDKQPMMGKRPYACIQDFRSKYYTGFPLGAPVNKCQWCSAHTPTPPPTPEPTASPTPFPTPPPTAPPTPPPTLAKGEGCEITFFSKKHFRGTKGTWKFPGTKFVGAMMNDKLQSWKAKGSQCKFCFYKHSKYIKFLGDRLAAKSSKLSDKPFAKGLEPERVMMKQVSSIRILDMRYTRNCPGSKPSWAAGAGGAGAAGVANAAGAARAAGAPAYGSAASGSPRRRTPSPQFNTPSISPKKESPSSEQGAPSPPPPPKEPDLGDLFR